MHSTTENPDGKNVDEDVNYSDFRVETNGEPTGFLIRAETESAAYRQAMVAAHRLEFDPGAVNLIEME